MPTQYSNFTAPDDENAPNPSPNAAPTTRTVLGAWGHQGDSVDANGVPVAGTNGMAQDVGRYRAAGQAGVPPTPQIDTTQSGESRGMSMGALGLLAARANGAMTPAQALAAQQTTGAVNAVQSGAASVHGGAMARAAAGRGAIAQGARVQATGDQDQAALAAREQADAAGSYFGAATGQRGLDLGLASSQADLEAQRRAANDQREGFYEGIAQDTQGANLNHQLGRSESDAAAAQAQYNNNVTRDQAARSAANTFTGVGIGGATGLAGVAGHLPAGSGQPAPAPAPANDGSGESGDWTDYNKDNDITSDENAKRNIKPVSDAEAARLSKAGDGMLFGMRAGLANGPAVHDKTAYDGKYLGSPFEKTAQSKPAAAKQSLDDAIGARVAQDAAEQPRYGYFDENDGGSKMRLGGNPGYAASRADQPGGMFGAPQAESKGPISREQYERNREVMLSDDRTKLAAAWDEGHQAAIQDVHKLQAKRPEDLRSLSDSNSLAGAVRDTKAGAFDEGKLAGGMSVRHDQMATAHADMDRAAAESEARMAARRAERPQDPNDVAIPGTVLPPAEPAPQSGGISNYFGQLAGRARAMIPSDKLAKNVDGEENAMAGANRAMTPSVYEYKPGFAEESGQKRGEKNVGPMAQNMAADPVASVAIVKRPDGYLAIDKDKGLKLVMGGLSDLQRQVDSMKGRRS